jgi:host factor-I protein
MAAKTPVNLQDGFLNQLRKDGILTTVYLINGFQLKGIVKGFDNFTVVLDSDGKQMLIYKHAMSPITPMKPISTNFTEPTPEKPKPVE